MTSATAPSLTEAVLPLALGAHVTGTAWMGTTPAFGLGDGAVVLAKDGGTHRGGAHPGGGILTTPCGGERFVSGGGDGRRAGTRPQRSTRAPAGAEKARVDALAPPA